MPVRPLGDADRARLTAFPREVPEEDLFAHFTLTEPDRALIPDRSAPSVRLGSALTVCAVRYLGFCPEDLAGAPERVLWHLGQQVGAPSESIGSYGSRTQTRSDHPRAAHAHPSYRAASRADLERLSWWLAERALEHNDQTLLVTLLAERMKAETLARPALYRLEDGLRPPRGPRPGCSRRCSTRTAGTGSTACSCPQRSWTNTRVSVTAPSRQR